MQQDFAAGHLKIEFAAEPFDSVPRLLQRSASLFFGNLPRLAALTLFVFIPTKFLLQWLLSALEIQEGGVLAYSLSAVSDLLLGSLVTPSLVYLLVGALRTGRAAPIRESLRWGERVWSKFLWNSFKMQVTVALWGLLLVVPGVVAAVRLAFTEVIVSVEGDLTADPLYRSRELAKGRGWKIFFVLAVLGMFDLLVWGAVLKLHLGLALTDCILAVTSQWTMTASLLMYLGITQASGITQATALPSTPPPPPGRLPPSR